MNTRTNKRRFGVIGLAVALLSIASCSIDASNQPPPTAEMPASAMPASTPATPATTATEAAIRPTADVDELVRVGGGRLHIRCVGAGETTVVLIAGFNDGGDNWGRITPALSGQSRVCSYARFGTGASDPPTTPKPSPPPPTISTPSWTRSASPPRSSSWATPTAAPKP